MRESGYARGAPRRAEWGDDLRQTVSLPLATVAVLVSWSFVGGASAGALILLSVLLMGGAL